MKLIYITSKIYPSTKADPFFTESMAKAFFEIMGQDFTFLIRGKVPDNLKRINSKSIVTPKHLRRLFYFFYLPVIIIFNRWWKRRTVFISYDPYLLSILVFWRKIFRFKYKVCSDWHQLFDNWTDKYVSSGSDYLISTSERLKSSLISVCGISEDKIKVAYGGVDLNLYKEKSKEARIKIRADLGLPNDKFIIGYIGSFKCMGMDKGIEVMLKTLSVLDRHFVMIFVGGVADHVKDYSNLAEKEGVLDRCIFLSWQKFEKVISYEIASDVLVIPYPNKRHFRDFGFPMKVWEYLASGRPIIYSNLDIMKEVLKYKAIDFIADNPHDLKKKIEYVYQNLKVVEENSNKQVSDVENYTWKKRAQNIIDFIKNE